MSNNTKQLEYLTEVTPEDVEGLFFLDYCDTQPVHWIRSPYNTLRDISIKLANLDYTQVERLRVQSLDELILPVNDSGLTRDECDQQGLEFVPECQKVEMIFGESYRITKGMLNKWKNQDGSWSCELGEGLYIGKKTGLLIADLSTISSPFVGSEGANKNPDTTYFLLDLSCHKQEIKEGMETLSKRCRHMTDNQTLISKLLEHALKRFLDYPDKSPVMNAITRLDEFVCRLEKKDVA